MANLSQIRSPFLDNDVQREEPHYRGFRAGEDEERSEKAEKVEE